MTLKLCRTLINSLLLLQYLFIPLLNLQGLIRFRFHQLQLLLSYHCSLLRYLFIMFRDRSQVLFLNLGVTLRHLLHDLLSLFLDRLDLLEHLLLSIPYLVDRGPRLISSLLLRRQSLLK